MSLRSRDNTERPALDVVFDYLRIRQQVAPESAALLSIAIVAAWQVDAAYVVALLNTLHEQSMRS